MSVWLLQSTPEFAGRNNIHPLGLAALAVSALALVSVRRAFAPVVLLALAAFIPSAQRIVIAGADFNFVRALVLVGLVRIVARAEWHWIRWNSIDLCVIAGTIARTVCFPIAHGTAAQVFASIGENFELIGAYFIVRSTIREVADLRALVSMAALITSAVAPFFLIEHFTGRNLFGVFGGVPLITGVREGRLRCQGAISHSILAGCFFVAWLPLWFALVIAGRRRERVSGIAGIAAGVVIVICCASSTPAVALILGFGVWLFYPMRRHLRVLYLGGIALAVVLHFVMAKPIWHLISRIDLVGGSTGYHRYRLIDAAINRFSEWWLVGTKTTEHWGQQLFDVTNQFILDSIQGGVWALLAMLGVFVFAFAGVGGELRRLARLRMAAAASRLMQPAVSRITSDEALVYGLGAAMCAQMAIFLAVSYFGQTQVVWQFLMALTACLAQWSKSSAGSAALVQPRREARAMLASRAPRVRVKVLGANCASRSSARSGMGLRSEEMDTERTA